MRRGLLICALFLGLVAPTAAARPGDLDPTFSRDGRLVDPRIYRPWALQVQDDGSLLVLGSALDGGKPVLARYSPDGRPDATFGIEGVAHPESAGRMAIQPDGRIVLGRSTADPDQPSAITVQRLLADGRPDMTFGDDGTVQIQSSQGYSLLLGAIGLDADGALMLAAIASTGADAHLELRRLLPDGTSDQRYGTNGTAVLSPPGRVGPVADMAIDADGAAVVAASTGNPFSLNVALLRADADGTPDSTFGNGGSMEIDLGRSEERAQLWRDAEGRLMLAVSSCTITGFDSVCAPYVLRFTPGGERDSTFGLDGGITPPYSGTYLPYPGDGRWSPLRRTPARRRCSTWWSLVSRKLGVETPTLAATGWWRPISPSVRTGATSQACKRTDASPSRDIQGEVSPSRAIRSRPDRRMRMPTA